MTFLYIALPVIIVFFLCGAWFGLCALFSALLKKYGAAAQLSPLLASVPFVAALKITAGFIPQKFEHTQTLPCAAAMLAAVLLSAAAANLFTLRRRLFWKGAVLAYCRRCFYGGSPAAVYAGSTFCGSFAFFRSKCRSMGDILQYGGLASWDFCAGDNCTGAHFKSTFCGALRFVYILRRRWLCLPTDGRFCYLRFGARRRACNRQYACKKIA